MQSHWVTGTMTSGIYLFCQQPNAPLSVNSHLNLLQWSTALMPCAFVGSMRIPAPRPGKWLRSRVTVIPYPWAWNWFRDEHRIQLRPARIKPRTCFKSLKECRLSSELGLNLEGTGLHCWSSPCLGQSLRIKSTCRRQRERERIYFSTFWW